MKYLCPVSFAKTFVQTVANTSAQRPYRNDLRKYIHEARKARKARKTRKFRSSQVMEVMMNIMMDVIVIVKAWHHFI